MKLFWLPLLACALAPTVTADTVWLTDLDLTKMHQGWNKPQINLAVTAKPLSIAGTQYDKGVGTHAPSSLWIDLARGSQRFQALVGLDDAAKGDAAQVQFKVIGDGTVLWDSGLMRRGATARSADVTLAGVKTLLLLVTAGPNGFDNAHADWVQARFETTGAKPTTLDPPKEEAVILTPPPPPTPRINGAKIFGVRPGSPFLFTIPATGDRPMVFSAEGLPAGLTLDQETGRISGSINTRGNYTVQLRARNSAGTGAMRFRIVCGDELALTPHMGWNSWYIWENNVTDQIMRDAADAMVQSGMINHGYSYVNVDDCWAVKPGATDPNLGGVPRDAAGKVNSNRRFPDMKALADYIHSRGLKAGIYTGPGPTTCAGHVAAYQHEQQDVERFVEWGFDFLKHDWCSYGSIVKNPSLEELQRPYRLMSDLLKKQPRDIVLNLCQYGMGNVWEWGKAVGGHSWRTAGDLGSSYEGIAYAIFRDGFDVYAKNELHKFARPGGWNDPDYLLLGYLSNWKGQTAPTPLTPNEQYTYVSLWCIVAAPLIFSGDMNRLDAFTLSLLTNDEVIDVDQDPLGKPGRRIAKTNDLEIWAKPMEDGSTAVGLFNRGEFESTVAARWAELGLKGPQLVRDLWRQKDLGRFQDQFESKVPRHGVTLVRVRPAE